MDASRESHPTDLKTNARTPIKDRPSLWNAVTLAGRAHRRHFAAMAALKNIPGSSWKQLWKTAGILWNITGSGRSVSLRRQRPFVITFGEGGGCFSFRGPLRVICVQTNSKSKNGVAKEGSAPLTGSEIVYGVIFKEQLQTWFEQWELLQCTCEHLPTWRG